MKLYNIKNAAGYDVGRVYAESVEHALRLHAEDVRESGSTPHTATAAEVSAEQEQREISAYTRRTLK